jgi:hypothetical protein
MHNWWIAALVSAGVWTEEQAQHVSDNIKTTIHKDNFKEALAELKAILSKGEFGIPSITELEATVASLENKVKLLTDQLATKIENDLQAEIESLKASVADLTLQAAQQKTPIAKTSKVS